MISFNRRYGHFPLGVWFGLSEMVLRHSTSLRGDDNNICLGGVIPPPSPWR
jgi:hypothetical protein